MRHRSRFQPIRSLTSVNDCLLNEVAYCRKHMRKYAKNVMNGGRIEAGKCPLCYPKPKHPASPRKEA